MATSADALATICEMAMGQWDAARCVEELGRFLASPLAVRLGHPEQLADVFTSTGTLATEAECSDAVERWANDKAHRLGRESIDREFNRLEAEISARIGAPASLVQQRVAAAHVACETAAMRLWKAVPAQTRPRCSRPLATRIGLLDSMS